MGGCGGLERTHFNSFYFGGCGGLERTHFQQFLLWKGVVALKELILTVSILGGCGGFERTDFNSFYFGRVWWS